MARPIRPTPHQTAMLRRIERGKLLVTMIDGKSVYSYEDGTKCNQDAAYGLIRRGWVRPESPGLIGGMPQGYVLAR